ncbi:LOW QUALITY PROTEIN: hypothetical protein V1478_018554 [Vespula squamosa]|uniref:Uncharacterized protein n=1 Tax=Vespula squamosa TaxID=30214 RepID=A0ABD1ZT48_VESSQ
MSKLAVKNTLRVGQHCRFTRDLLDVNKALVSSREKQLGKTSSKTLTRQSNLPVCTFTLRK